MLEDYKDIQDIKKNLLDQQSALLYISSQNCSVCKAVLPKLEQLLAQFSEVKSMKCKIEEVPGVGGEYMVFTVPTILIFYDGKEVFRTSRFVEFNEIEKMLSQMTDSIT